MKGVIKQFFKDYFLAVGLTTVIVIICYYAFEGISEKNALDILGTMLVAVLPISLLGAMLFRNVQTKEELWIRRSVIIAFSCINYPLCFILSGLIKRDTLSQYVIFVLLDAVFISVSCIIAYIIADRIEKKKIEEINRKLSEMK